MTDWMHPARPYAIAHRGASAYAPGNTLRAFELAATLGADLWEVDIRLTRDGRLVAHHDATLADGRAIADLDYDTLRAVTRAAGRPMALLDEVLRLARARDAGIYADVKDLSAVVPTLEALQAHGIERAVIGAFDAEAARRLEAAGSPYPRAVLVPLGVEPFAHARGADIVHLCWERMDRPQDALTSELFEQARRNSQAIVIWHEEDPVRMAAIRDKPIFGICSDRPELVHPFVAPEDWPVTTVAHRGANTIAPENTLEAAECAFAAGFDVVELDIHTSCDGELVVIHDYTVNRTTDGQGLVTDFTLDELRRLDAGSWFDPHFSHLTLPTLTEMLDLGKRYGRQIYVEIKKASVSRVLEAVETADMLDNVFFWSYRHDQLKELKARDARARIMLRRQDFETLEQVLASLQPALIEYMPEDDWSELDAVRAAGVPLMICYMGRDSGTMDQVIAARPDIVNIDDLFLFRRRLAAHGLTRHG